MTHNPRCDRGRSLMANVILFWSDSLLRIKLSESYKAFLENMPHRILGDFCMIIIIYFSNCCRASAGSRPYSWAIWDFSFNGSMVRCSINLWLQRCALISLLKQVLGCRACFSLGKICAEIVVHRMFAVFFKRAKR